MYVMFKLNSTKLQLNNRPHFSISLWPHDLLMSSNNCGSTTCTCIALFLTNFFFFFANFLIGTSKSLLPTKNNHKKQQSSYLFSNGKKLTYIYKARIANSKEHDTYIYKARIANTKIMATKQSEHAHIVLSINLILLTIHSINTIIIQ